MVRQQKVDESGAVGTPLYFSPEQMQHAKDDKKAVNYDTIGEKVDIYSLGLILLELSCDISTTHEKHSSFIQVKEMRRLPSKLQKTLVGKIIMNLTEVKPEKRP